MQPRAVAVAVVGGGVIGLAIAWRLARAGADVAVVDPALGSGASFVAAGLLAPVTEVPDGDHDLLRLSLRSAEQWPSFAAELEQAGGLDVAFRACGTLAVAADDGDRTLLEDLQRFQGELALASTWCEPAEARALEPLLAPQVRGALLVPGDHQVDPRRVVAALAAACAAASVVFVAEAAEAVVVGSGAVRGVRLASGEELGAPVVVVATGAAPGLGGLAPGTLPPVRPVKGQILRLRFPPGLPLPVRTVRAVVQSRSVYIVPRLDGEVVVGATVEEVGEDRTVTAAAVAGLRRAAEAVVPAIAEAELVEASAGLRPASADDAPYLGAGGPDGLVVATGHYRNGILLAPVTAEVIVAALAGRPLSFAAAFAPDRAVALAAGDAPGTRR